MATWTSGGNTCNGPLPSVASGSSSAATNITTGYSGTATYNCNGAGAWVVSGTPTCLQSCGMSTIDTSGAASKCTLGVGVAVICDPTLGKSCGVKQNTCANLNGVAGKTGYYNTIACVP
jgi:hypothetical protein